MNIRKYFSSGWFYALVLLLVMFFTYGLQITRLGFFWDDWQVVFLARFKDPQIYWDYFLNDRPFSAWTYILTVPVLGIVPLRWQLFTLVVRWLSILGFCWALRGIWPKSDWQIRWVGLLMAVYPGFTQQPVSVAYSQHFITMALFALSMGLMIWSVRRPERFWLFTSLALLCSLGHLMTMEYFFGLELLRSVILWLLLRQKDERIHETAWNVIKRWGPYLAPLGIFLVYRFPIFGSMFPELEANPAVLILQIAEEPLSGIIRFLQIALQDFIHTILFVWTNTIHPDTITLNVNTTLFSWFVGMVVAVFIAWYMSRPERQEKSLDDSEGSFVHQGMIIGVLGVLLGGLPVWATNRQIIVGLWSDRFSLGPMLGAVILVICLVEWLGGTRFRKSIFLAVLLGIAVASQIRNVDQYRRHWAIQKDYYRQVSWRIPRLKAGTAIVGPELSFSYVGDYSLGFAFNVLYDSELNPTQVPYWWINGLRSWEPEVIQEFEDDSPIEYTIRNVMFEGLASNSLAITYNHARGCVRVMDPIYLLSPPMTEGDNDIWPLAHPDQIEDSPGVDTLALRKIFGRDQEPDWCYYFEKADLARQFKKWEKAGALGDEAAELGLQPKHGAELVPFIEGYAHLGQWDKAYQYTLDAEERTQKMETLLCSTWRRIENQTESSADRDSTLNEVNAELKCRQKKR